MEPIKPVLDYRAPSRPLEITPLEERRRDLERQRTARRLLLLLVIVMILIFATAWICVDWYHADI